MIDLYRNQLRLVLEGYRQTLSDMSELSWAIERIKVKSSENRWKQINIEEAERRLSELFGNPE